MKRMETKKIALSHIHTISHKPSLIQNIHLKLKKKEDALQELLNYMKRTYTLPALNTYIAEVINLLHHNENITCYIFLNHTTRTVKCFSPYPSDMFI